MSTIGPSTRPRRALKPVSYVDARHAEDGEVDADEPRGADSGAPLTAGKPKSRSRKPAAGGSKAKSAAAGGNTLYDAVVNDADLSTHVDAFLAGWEAAGADEGAKAAARKPFTDVLLRLAGASEAVADGVDASLDFGDDAAVRELVEELVPDVEGAAYAVLPPERGGAARAAKARAGLARLARELVARARVGALAGEDGLAERLADVALPLSTCAYVPLRHAALLACAGLALALHGRAEAVEADAAAADAAAAPQAAIAANLAAKAARAGGRDAPGAKAAKDAGALAARSEAEAAAGRAHAAALAKSAGDLVAAFVQYRYRDDAPGVRADTLDALGALLVAHPALYLTNGYLKYLGWLLNDVTSAHVRAAALAALARVYTLPADKVARANEFMTRFKGRIAEMARDVDEDVAAAAVRVLHAALNAEQLTIDEVDCAREALVSDFPAVRAAAGAMLLDFFPAFDETADQLGAGGGAGEDAPEDGEGAPGGGDGRRPGARKGKGGDGGKAAAKAAAAAAERARRSREQLLSIVEAAASLLPPDAKDAGGDASAGSMAVAALVLDAFWAAPRGRVLEDWGAYRAALLGGGGGGDAAGGGAGGAGGGGGAGAGGAPELSPLQARIAMRLLAEAAARVDDGATFGVHARAPGGGGGGGGAGGVTTAPAAVEAAAAAMSSALAGLLPELLTAFGDDAGAAAVLSSVACLLRPSAFQDAPGARHAAALAAQLCRVVARAASPLALEAAAGALRELSAEHQPRAKDVRVALGRLVASLTASFVRSVSALAAGGGGGRGAAGAKAPARARRGAPAAAAGADADGDEDILGAEARAAEEAAAGASPADLALYTAQQARRLRVLTDVLVAGGGPGGAAPPELDATAPAGAPLLAALDALLVERLELPALFASAAAAAAAGAGGGGGSASASDDDAPSIAAALDALAPALASEAARLLAALFRAAAVRALARVAAAAGAPPAEREDAARAVAAAAALRDRALAHFCAAVRARHPALVAAYAARAGLAAGAEELDAPAAVAAAYVLTDALPPAEAVYVMRVRRAGFLGLVGVGLACGRAALAGTLAEGLAWAPGDAECSLLGTFVNNELDLTGSSLIAQGLDLPGAATAGALDGEEGGEDEALDEAAAAVRAARALTEKDAARAAAGVRRDAAGGLAAALAAQRAGGTLAHLVALALASPETDKVGSSVARRLADELNEAGAPGIAFSRAYADRLKDAGKWRELLSAQLRSVADGVKYVARMVLRMRELQAAAPGEDGEGGEGADADAAADAAAALEEHSSTTLAAVEQLTSVARKQVAALGKPRGNELVVVVKAVESFLRDALAYSDAWPWRAALFAFVMPYLTVVPADKQANLFNLLLGKLEEHIDASLPNGGAEAEAAWAAARTWWEAIAKASDASGPLRVTTVKVKGAHVSIDAARPWVPAAAMLALLRGGSAAKKYVDAAMGNALRAYTGSATLRVAPAAPALGASAVSWGLAASGARSRSRAGAGGGGGGGGGASSGGGGGAASAPAPAPPGASRGRRTTLPARGGASQATAGAESGAMDEDGAAAAAAAEEEEDEEEELTVNRRTGPSVAPTLGSESLSSSGTAHRAGASQPSRAETQPTRDATQHDEDEEGGGAGAPAPAAARRAAPAGRAQSRASTLAAGGTGRAVARARGGPSQTQDGTAMEED